MAGGIFTSRIEGTKLEIRIPALGVLVSEAKRPLLLRRPGDNGPNEGQFDLQAAVSYWNEPLWKDEDFEKEVTVWVGKSPLKVSILEGTKVTRVEQSLRMEGVKVE